MRSLKIRSTLVAGATAALLAGGAAPVAVATANSVASGTHASPAVQKCEDGSSVARVRNKKGKEPAQDPNAAAYGRIKAQPRMPNGSVHIPVAFHMIQSASEPSSRSNADWTSMVDAQIQVLNDAFSGAAEPAGHEGEGADTPFRFDLQSIEFVKNDAWYTVGLQSREERSMKRALYTGNSETLNVYAGNIGDGLLGWAYFPQGYNSGRDYIDGVVMLDESMPGGSAGKYSLGDTLTHEVGHWLALHHTFQAGCSASNDFVKDTPKEAIPQFDCPEGADTCTAPGLDPIHNFMDYTQDSCMYLFTKGQAQRMNDAWINFRAVP
ncbi:zinc metalloprotease [Nocardioides guangzhouensis]|uniref:Zinc metalloprotease n=1 Tax=Nocardioides guangzhouensis TaxID=2497878 RepID=A0A4Q4ZBT8_9ACTN|nr:zinc metalloprotease [Nocardioides guangzhouensis]RYP84746.1 zinc metalloprotease [Nocardioides guangzhouensis]